MPLSALGFTALCLFSRYTHFRGGETEAPSSEESSLGRVKLDLAGSSPYSHMSHSPWVPPGWTGSCCVLMRLFSFHTAVGNHGSAREAAASPSPTS